MLSLSMSSYHSAKMSVAVVLVDTTCFTQTGMKVPALTATKVTLSPPTVITCTSPAPPIYKIHPLLEGAPVMGGITAVAAPGVTAAALPT